jgi:cytochrome bd-type quinol oxidase subunit 2
MEPSHIVASIMITFAVVYLLLEIVLNLNDMENDTSNIVLLEWSRGKFFFIPFGLGAVAGHLFLGTENDVFKLPNSMYPVIILFVLAILSVIIGHKKQFEKTKTFLTTLLLLGVVYGHLFWSMNYVTPLQP